LTDGLRCQAVTISTRARLLADGADHALPFQVFICREDGVTFDVAVLTLARLQTFIESLNPPSVYLATADADDVPTLQAIIDGSIGVH